MPSQLRSDTARANGAKSRGPKSPETKEKSSKNALRHGLTARHTLLLACENAGQLNQLQEQFESVHQPATPAEEDLVDEMVAARWRIRRSRAVEVVMIDCEILRRKSEVEKQFAQPDSGVHLGMAIRNMSEESPALAHLSRYEARLQRAYNAAYRTLRELQRVRNADKPEPPKQGKPAEGNRLRAMPSAPPKNDETNPTVLQTIRQAVSRHFSKTISIPEFPVMEVLNRPWRPINAL